MKWITDFFRRWQIAREARRENYLRHLAIAKPGFQWIIVKAGTDVQARSPMLAMDEIRDWFREFYPNCTIVHIDEDNKVVFYV